MATLIPRRGAFDFPLVDVQKQMNRFFDDFFGGFGLRTGETTQEWMPEVDVAETDSEILVKAEIPGIDAKDVDVTIAGNTLAIRGEKREEREEDGRNWYRHERRFGSFQRIIDLPVPVDADKVKAEYRNGVLSLSIPKREEARSRTIKVQVK
jgi:HSP20 family protein